MKAPFSFTTTGKTMSADDMRKFCLFCSFLSDNSNNSWQLPGTPLNVL